MGCRRTLTRMSPRDADILLSVLRSSYGLTIGVSHLRPDGPDETWRVEARDDNARAWVVECPSYAGAALELAAQLGFEVEDG